MKKSGMTIVFVVICIGVLVAAYGVGVCIREIRFRRARAETEVAAEAGKPGAEPQAERGAQEPTPAADAQVSEGEPSPPTRAAGSGRGRMGPTREQLESMSEEERREAIAQMRERFGGRRREGGPQLSEEDRTKMREEMEQLRERSEDMSEEEMAEARAKIFEKYGITPRGSGGRPGGDRGSGAGGGGRRRAGGGDGAAPPKGRTCFVAETPVWVDGKLVQISEVTAGQAVGKQGCGSSSVEQVQEHEGTFECRDIVLESGNTIGVVDAHCFMLDSGQWIAAQNLTSGLRLKTLTGTVGVMSVMKRAVPYTGKVYNLKVKSSDQYVVGRDMIIVRDH